METSLHRGLKERFASESGGLVEKAVAGFRIDAIDGEGRLVEVQSASLGPLRSKLGRLLPEHRVRVVKPVVVSRRIVRRARREGPDLSSRFSPRRGVLLDVFDDLVGLARLFPHPNLHIDVLGVEIDELRIPRRRRPGFQVIDRRLLSVVQTLPLVEAPDLWTLLPSGLTSPFTTLDLADHLRRPVPFAQKVAYCLRLSGAATVVGKSANRRIYVAPQMSPRLANDPEKPLRPRAVLATI